jgi:hypothetical protein
VLVVPESTMFNVLAVVLIFVAVKLAVAVKAMIGTKGKLVFNKTEPLDLKTFLSEKNENFDDKKYKEKKKLISKILNSQEIKPTLTQSNKLNYDDINRNNVAKNNKSKINSAINRVQNLSNDTKKHFGKKNIK